MIERLRTTPVDVQPQNQLGEGSIAVAKNLNITANEKTGRITLNRPSTEILSTAEANLKAKGGLTRLDSELPGMDWSRS